MRILDVEGRLGARMSTILFLPILSVGVVLLIALYLRPPRACTRALSALGSHLCHPCKLQTRQQAAVTTGVLKVLISYAQCLGALQRFPLVRWPRIFDAFMAALDQLNLEVFSTLPPECLTGGRLGFFTELAFWMSVPLLSLAGVLLIAAAMWATRKGCGEPADASSDGWRGLLAALNHPRVYKVLTWTMLLIYPSLARKSLATFDCLAAGLDASGAPVVLLRDDPVEPCYVGAWIGWAVVAGVGVAVYCLGLPLIALLAREASTCAPLRTPPQASAPRCSSTTTSRTFGIAKPSSYCISSPSLVSSTSSPQRRACSCGAACLARCSPSSYTCKRGRLSTRSSTTCRPLPCFRSSLPISRPSSSSATAARNSTMRYGSARF